MLGLVPYVAVLATLLTGCINDSAPVWAKLADVTTSGPIESLLAVWNDRKDERIFSFDSKTNSVTVEIALPDQGWRKDGDKLWRHPLPTDIESLDHVSIVWQNQRLSIPTARSQETRAELSGKDLLLRLPPNETPSGARLEGQVCRGSAGRAPTDKNTDEDALIVWPGQRVECIIDVPADSALRFQPRVRPLLGPAHVIFRVLLNGRIIHEASRDARLDVESPVIVDLGNRAIKNARIAFEVEGDPAATLIARPLVGPAEIGTYAARPWGPSPPNVVLFLADTFRADLFSMHGGEPELLPELNALAERSACFLETRSTSTWTLPSHGSLFTGLWPMQHGAERLSEALPDDLDTLAELFSRAGYRTGAITDGAFVTRTYGMDQGFEAFCAQRRHSIKLSRTLEWASDFIAADDGRPFFLFVHTFRTHWPYRVGAHEDDSSARALKKKVASMMRAAEDSGPLERGSRFAEELHAIYREGARALDAEFGPWFQALEESGVFANGILVFTSDHGEAFAEHGRFAHNGKPYDEEAHVPLLVHGARIRPGKCMLGASLIDVAPTLANYCSISRPAGWGGQDLLSLDEERVLFSTVANKKQRSVAAIRDRRKVIANGTLENLASDITEAYDLRADPLEQTNSHANSWSRELGQAATRDWVHINKALTAVPGVLVEGDLADELKALGYVGDDEGVEGAPR